MTMTELEEKSAIYASAKNAEPPSPSTADCPRCEGKRCVAEHNCLWTCHICRHQWVIDPDSQSDEMVRQQLQRDGSPAQAQLDKARAAIPRPHDHLRTGDLQVIAELLGAIADGPRFVLERKSRHGEMWLHGRVFAEGAVGIAFRLGEETPYDTAAAIAQVAFELGRQSILNR